MVILWRERCRLRFVSGKRRAPGLSFQASFKAMSDSPDNLTDSGPTETKVDGSGDLTRQQRDPNDPIAVVGLGASAGGVAVLQQFFTGMPSDSGLAFVVVMHLAPDFESNLASILQLKTSMPVIQVHEGVKVLSNHVYVIPPNKQLLFENGSLCLIEGQQRAGRRVTIDLFFRTLAQSYGHRAVSVILTGSDSDGVIGLKHVRAQGGVTVAQDPQEAEYDSMPLTAISTGMVDWVLPVAKMPAKLLEFAQNGSRLQLPPEIAEAGELDPKTMSARGGETGAEEIWTTEDESALQQVLAHLRDQTGHDFEYYKRATILRRITRRLHVNSINRLPEYLDFLQKHPAESRALLQDLLIGVTHFFRDQESFAALAANIPQLFAGKKKDDQIRVWVAGCATGEEAYSIAILLTEHAERLDAPPAIQIFATDIDKLAVREAREGLYPSTIEADVSQERLYRFFSKDHGQYRIRKDLREKVLFVAHNVLSDPPFSRLDLVSCRNLLIYLKNKAQTQAFDIFHFSLRPSGLLFIGGSETADPGSNLFTPLDSKNRLFVRLSVPRAGVEIADAACRCASTRSAAHGARRQGCTAAADSKGGGRNRARHIENSFRGPGTPHAAFRRVTSQAARAVWATFCCRQRSARHRPSFRECRALSELYRRRAVSELAQGYSSCSAHRAADRAFPSFTNG